MKILMRFILLLYRFEGINNPLFRVIPSGLLGASVLNEVAVYQHLDVALDRFRGNSRLSLDPRHFQPWMGLDAVENHLLAGV